MLHPPTADAQLTETRATGRPADRSMDILQYGMAAFALLVALLLGATH